MILNQGTIFFELLLHDICQRCWLQRSLEAGSGTWVLQEKKHKDISVLTETHISHDQIHHIKNNWLGPIFFFPVDSHTKRMLVLLHLGLEGINEVDTNPKGRIVSFKVTSSNDRVLYLYVPSAYSIREQLAMGRFFEGP